MEKNTRQEKIKEVVTQVTLPKYNSSVWQISGGMCQSGKRLVWKCSKNSDNDNEQHYSLFSIGQELPKNCEQWEYFEILYSSIFDIN